MDLSSWWRLKFSAKVSRTASNSGLTNPDIALFLVTSIHLGGVKAAQVKDLLKFTANLDFEMTLVCLRKKSQTVTYRQ